MKPGNERFKSFIISLPEILIFLIGLIFLTLFAGHVFHYQEQTSLFIISWEHLLETTGQPGGFLVYISEFLTSFFHIPVAGALIATGIIWLTIVLSSKIILLLSSERKSLIPVIAGLGMFWLQTDYQYLLFNNLGLMLQVFMFCLVVKKSRGWLPVLLFPLWFFLTGGFSWIFFLLYLIWSLKVRERQWIIKIPSLILISVIAFLLSGEYLFFQTTLTLFAYPFTPDSTGSQLIVFHLVALLIILLPLFAGIRLKSPFRTQIPVQLRPAVAAGLTLLLMAGISLLKYDSRTLHYFKAEKLFIDKKYNEVIEFNLKHPSNNYLTLYLNNLALCETGQLNDRLFSFNQSPDGKTLFLKWEIVGEILRRGGYFYYTTGMINEAHRWAFEYMVINGNTPEGLRMLIRTELINGNYITAERYIRLLKSTIFYRKEAKEYDELLYDPFAVNSHPELGQKLKIRLRKDFFAITDDPLTNLQRIVASDSLNRYAFDYLMAYFLITKDYKSIVSEWGNLGRYGYTKIPIHIEEAGVAIKNLYNETLPGTGSLRINPDTELRFNQYLQTFQSSGADLKRAESPLRARFGNTFWYWVFYK